MSVVRSLCDRQGRVHDAEPDAAFVLADAGLDGAIWGARHRPQVVQRVGGRGDRVGYLLRSEFAPPVWRDWPANVVRLREHELLWQISLGAARHRNGTEGAIPESVSGSSSGSAWSDTAGPSFRTRRAGHHRRARCSPGSTVMQPSTSWRCRGTSRSAPGHRGQSGCCLPVPAGAGGASDYCPDPERRNAFVRALD